MSHIKITHETLEEFEKELELNGLEELSSPEAMLAMIEVQDVLAIKTVINHLKTAKADLLDLFIEKSPEILSIYLDKFPIDKIQFSNLLNKKTMRYDIICLLADSFPGEFEYKICSNLVKICTENKNDFLFIEYIKRNNKIFPEWFNQDSFLTLQAETVVYLIEQKILTISLKDGRSYNSDHGTSAALHRFIAQLPLKKSDIIVPQLYALIAYKVNTVTIDYAIECENVDFLKKYLKASHMQSGDRRDLFKGKSALVKELSLSTGSKTKIIREKIREIFSSGDSAKILDFLSAPRPQKSGPKKAPKIELNLSATVSTDSDESSYSRGSHITVSLLDLLRLPQDIQTYILEKNRYSSELSNHFSDKNNFLYSILDSFVSKKGYNEVLKDLDQAIAKFRNSSENEQRSNLYSVCEFFSWKSYAIIKNLKITEIIEYVDCLDIPAEIIEKGYFEFFTKQILKIVPSNDDDSITLNSYTYHLSDLYKSELISREEYETGLRKHLMSPSLPTEEKTEALKLFSNLVKRHKDVKKIIVTYFIFTELGGNREKLNEDLISVFKSSYDLKENLGKLMYLDSNHEELKLIFNSLSNNESFLAIVQDEATRSSHFEGIQKVCDAGFIINNEQDKKSPKIAHLWDINHKHSDTLKAKNSKISFKDNQFTLKLDPFFRTIIRLIKESIGESVELCFRIENVFHSNEFNRIIPFTNQYDELIFESKPAIFDIYIALANEHDSFLNKILIHTTDYKKINNQSDSLNNELIDYYRSLMNEKELLEKLAEILFENRMSLRGYNCQDLARDLKLLSKKIGCDERVVFTKLYGKQKRSSAGLEGNYLAIYRETMSNYPELIPISDLSSFDPIVTSPVSLILDKVITSQEYLIWDSAVSRKVSEITGHQKEVSAKEIAEIIMPDFSEKDKKIFIVNFKKLNDETQSNPKYSPESLVLIPFEKINSQVSGLYKTKLTEGTSNQFCNLLRFIKIVRPNDLTFKPVKLKDGSIRMEQGLATEKILSGANINAYFDFEQGNGCDWDGINELFNNLLGFISTEKLVNILKNGLSPWVINDSVTSYKKIIGLDEISTEKAFKMNKVDLIAYLKKELSRKKTITDIHDFLSHMTEYIAKENLDFSSNQEFLGSINKKEYSGGYVLDIPKETADLIRVGQELSICVGRSNYDEKIIEGTSLVLFLEGKKNKICVEFKIVRSSNGTVDRYTLLQAKTNKNKDMSDQSAIGELLKDVNDINDRAS